MNPVPPRLPWRPFTKCIDCERAAEPRKVRCDHCQTAIDREHALAALKHAASKDRA